MGKKWEILIYWDGIPTVRRGTWKEGIWFTRFQTPKGFRDLSPADVKKYLFVEGKFRESFGLWGYSEVRTSSLDYFDVIRGGAGAGFGDSIFKVQDWDGRLLSMRGEVTTQVARMLASKSMKEARIFYVANCIRFQERRILSQREFWQAGAELIGGSEVEGDAEAIALALRSLDAMGISDAYADIGNVGLFRELAVGLGVGDLEGLKRAMASKSLAGLKGAVKDGEALDVFSSLIKRRGGVEVITELAEGIRETGKYVKYFKELFGCLEAFGLGDRVSIDLTTLREMDYYNGTVFDIYVGGVGVPIGGGGRYDTMMEEFGMGSAKATGFALSVDLCVKALDSRGFRYDGSRKPIRVLFREGYAEKAIGLSEGLRRRGIACSMDAYRGEKEGVLVGMDVVDIATGKAFKAGRGGKR